VTDHRGRHIFASKTTFTSNYIITLENTEAAIKNEQSRETGNIWARNT